MYEIFFISYWIVNQFDGEAPVYAMVDPGLFPGSVKYISSAVIIETTSRLHDWALR